MRTLKIVERRLPAALTIMALGVACAGTSVAADDPKGVTHFIDTSTDRIPALTAFPKYPTIARRDRIEGEATVCFKVKTNGRISRPVVTDSTHRIFSKPALRAIKKSTFEPLGPGQILDTARTCRTYRFRLDPILVKNDEG
jgi:TonB family protein